MWPTSTSSQFTLPQRWLGWWSRLAPSQKTAFGLVVLGTVLTVFSTMLLFLPYSQAQAAPSTGIESNYLDLSNSSTDLLQANSAVTQFASSSSTLSSIWVEVSGAVTKPGVYELPAGSRVRAALDLAEGVTADAQPDFVLKSLNQASILEDEAKLYIPFRGETVAISLSSSPAQPLPADSGPILISLNSASLAQLEELPGIGTKRAEDIINGRPYQKIDEVVEREIVTDNIWADIQNLIKL